VRFEFIFSLGAEGNIGALEGSEFRRDLLFGFMCYMLAGEGGVGWI
jgi:hypothetical protein